MFEKWLNRENAYIFRITHFQNLSFILSNGIACRNGLPQDANFVSIGSYDIIEKRDKVNIGVNPKGTLSDYIPFYFAPRSPMLYSIRKGTICSQEDIVYIVSKAEKIIALKVPFVFTDGHALIKLSNFYNQEKDLIHVDWKVMNRRYWNIEAADNDIKRRRMAEFLVYKHFPVEAIGLIVTKSPDKMKQIMQILTNFGLTIPVEVRQNWFF